MLSKQLHIECWKRSGLESWDTGEYLIKGNRNVNALFMFCLAIKKLLKGNWVLGNLNDYPQRIHDLQTLWVQTEIEQTAEQIDFFDTVNSWNIEGRYPDYKFSLYRQVTDNYSIHQLQKLLEVKKCLLERI